MWWGGRVQVHNDPLLRTLGDVWLKTGGYILDSNFDINSNVVHLLNCNVLKDNFQKTVCIRCTPKMQILLSNFLNL